MTAANGPWLGEADAGFCQLIGERLDDWRSLVSGFAKVESGSRGKVCIGCGMHK